ncbi:MAG: TrmB family transcriptional regulator [Halolamina sp.]
MDSAELRAALEDAGLSQYQAEAYTSLLQLGTASATELADACSVPTARIYDVLRDLETKGYIDTFEQDSLRARARDPDTALEELRGRAERLTDAAAEIEAQWEQPAVDQHRVSIVKRFETVAERARQSIREAENEVQLAVTPESYRRLRDACAQAFDNGAVVKVAVITETGGDPPAIDFDGEVTEARHRRLPTPFVALVDRSVTCFAPHHDSLNEYGVLVDDYTLTYVFHWYFLTCLWEGWQSIHEADAGDLPPKYVNIRRCVSDLEALLNDGGTARVGVRGIRTDDETAVTLTGEVVDVEYAGGGAMDSSVDLQLASQVTLRLRTDDGETVTVGGWGAVIEDVEAKRITIESVDRPTRTVN